MDEQVSVALSVSQWHVVVSLIELTTAFSPEVKRMLRHTVKNDDAVNIARDARLHIEQVLLTTSLYKTR